MEANIVSYIMPGKNYQTVKISSMLRETFKITEWVAPFFTRIFYRMRVLTSPYISPTPKAVSPTIFP